MNIFKLGETILFKINSKNDMSIVFLVEPDFIFGVEKKEMQKFCKKIKLIDEGDVVVLRTKNKYRIFFKIKSGFLSARFCNPDGWGGRVVNYEDFLLKLNDVEFALNSI